MFRSLRAFLFSGRNLAKVGAEGSNRFARSKCPEKNQSVMMGRREAAFRISAVVPTKYGNTPAWTQAVAAALKLLEMTERLEALDGPRQIQTPAPSLSLKPPAGSDFRAVVDYARSP